MGRKKASKKANKYSRLANLKKKTLSKADKVSELSKEKTAATKVSSLIDASANISNLCKSEGKHSKSESRPTRSDECNDNKVTLGTFCQGNLERYGYYAGKQCVPNSLVSIVFTKLFETKVWDSSILDKILDHGNELYIYIQSLKTTKNDYLLVNELPRTVEVCNKYFSLDISNASQVGLIGRNTNLNNDIGLSLYQALQTCFLQYNNCFITFGNNTFSVMKQHDKFFIFDSHSRNRNGMVVAEGTSVMLEVNSIQDVYQHCLNLSVSMDIPCHSQFEITESKCR